MKHHADSEFIYLELERHDFSGNRWKGFLSDLKEAIPDDERDYSDDDKRWTIDIKHMATIKTLYQTHYLNFLTEYEMHKIGELINPDKFESVHDWLMENPQSRDEFIDILSEIGE